MLEQLSAWFDGVKAEFILNFVEKNRWKMLVTGLENTLIITFFALLIGMAIGVVIAVERTTRDQTRQGRRSVTAWRMPKNRMIGASERAISPR